MNYYTPINELYYHVTMMKILLKLYGDSLMTDIMEVAMTISQVLLAGKHASIVTSHSVLWARQRGVRRGNMVGQ